MNQMVLPAILKKESSNHKEASKNKDVFEVLKENCWSHSFQIFN